MWPGLAFSVLLVLVALFAALIFRSRGSGRSARSSGGHPSPKAGACQLSPATTPPSEEDRLACVALAEAVVGGVRAHTMWRAMTVPLVPPPGRGASGLCPR